MRLSFGDFHSGVGREGWQGISKKTPTDSLSPDVNRDFATLNGHVGFPLARSFFENRFWTNYLGLGLKKFGFDRVSDTFVYARIFFYALWKGARMAWICNQCGYGNSNEDRKCKNCGVGERPEIAIVDDRRHEEYLDEE